MGVSDKWGEKMRYIDVDDVASAIYHHFPSVRTMADARSVIEEVPTIDAVSVVHGEWIEDYNGNGWNDYWDYTCSNCGKRYERADAVLCKANYCPNCGAKMREVRDE